MRQKIKILEGILVLSFFFFISFARGEDLTITTYYPSPYGSYKELTWGCAGSVAELKAVGGGSIDLGGKNCDGTLTANPELNFWNTFTSNVVPQVQLRLENNNLVVNNGDLIPGSGRILTSSATCVDYINQVGSNYCPSGSWALACGTGWCNTLGVVATSLIYLYPPGAFIGGYGCPIEGHMICVRHD